MRDLVRCISSCIRSYASSYVGLYVLALAAAVLVGSRGPVYWDGFGYVAQSLGNYVGGLALGRPLFVLASHQLTRGFLDLGVSAWDVEPWLRGAWLLVAATSAPVTYALARRIRLSRRGSLLAGLLVALSPAMAHASAAVMTDAPSTATTLISLVICARAVGRGSVATSTLAGASLGVACGLREQAILALPCAVLLLARSRRGQRVSLSFSFLAGLVVALVAPVAWLAHVQEGYAGRPSLWLEAMTFERHAYPYGPRDLVAYLTWLVLLGPVIVPAAIASLVTSRRSSTPRPMILPGSEAERDDALVSSTVRSQAWARPGTAAFAVLAPFGAQLVAMAFFHDIALGPRFLLPSFAGSLVLLAARGLDAWLGMITRAKLDILLASLGVPLLVGSMLVHQRESPLRTMVDGLPSRLHVLPDDVVIVTGQGCPALEMIEQMARIDPGPLRHHTTRFPRICAGWSWPPSLEDALAESQHDGALPVVDLREGAWSGARQQAARDEAQAYVDRHAEDESNGRVIVWR